MKITFCGAARTVTGSCYLIENAGVRFLVDCGSFQGSDEDQFARGEFPFNPADIDFVLLTHAHIDHSGRLPLLVKKGFKGSIFCTGATKKLSGIMLLDSAHIQEMEAAWGYKKAKRGSGKMYKPLYDTLDAEKCIKKLVAVPYDKVKKISDGISFCFRDAGHLLGSAHIEVFLKEGGREKKVVFSGDIGNANQPLIKNPTYIKDADVVLTESTYGDELHPSDGANPDSVSRAKKLAEIIDETFKQGGNLVIPAFSVGRTQEILYFLHIIWKKKLLPYKVPVFMDSPMGIKATDIFAASVAECFDEEASKLVKKGENPLHFPSLLVAESEEDSKHINSFPDPCVIISSSGMCNAGRIKHHLKYNLWRENSAVLFTGYQAGGTLGRMIIDGAHTVRIFGEEISVKAKIYTMKNLSGHADQSGILKWLSNFDRNRLKQIFVVHGEEKSVLFFAGFLGKELGVNAYAPEFNQSIDLLSGEVIGTEYRPFEDSQERIQLESAVTVLEHQLKSLEDVVAEFKKSAGAQNLNEKKKVKKLVNKLLYLSSDVEDLAGKWKGMTQ